MKLRYSIQNITSQCMIVSLQLEILFYIKKKKFFFNIFDRTINKLNYSMFHQQFILKLPRNIIEIIAFSIIIIVTIYFVELRNYEFSKIASLLAFYGICTLKYYHPCKRFFFIYFNY